MREVSAESDESLNVEALNPPEAVSELRFLLDPPSEPGATAFDVWLPPREPCRVASSPRIANTCARSSSTSARIRRRSVTMGTTATAPDWHWQCSRGGASPIGGSGRRSGAPDRSTGSDPHVASAGRSNCLTGVAACGSSPPATGTSQAASYERASARRWALAPVRVSSPSAISAIAVT